MSRGFHEEDQRSLTRSRSRSRRQSNRKENNVGTPFDEEQPKKSKWWIKAIVFCVAEVIALVFIFGYSYAIRQYNRIQRPIFNEENVKNSELSIEKIKEMEEGYWNIAVFGVDSRDKSVGKGWNSDVIIVVSINRGTGEIKMSSVYRDTYLDTGYGKLNKINNAYAVGGPEQALKAINKNLDLNITDYVTFNWSAVATAINILGGVDVDITKAEFKYINSYITDTVKGTDIGSVHLKQPGMNHLDGIQAVAYARLRYMDSDFERTERQRKIIQLAFDKAKKADLKTLNDLLGNMLSMVATNMTWQDGLDVIAKIDKYKIGETTGFPFTKGGVNVRGKGVVVAPQNLVSNVKELHKFLFGDEAYEVSNTVQDINYRIGRDGGRGYGDDDGGGKKKNKETLPETTPTQSTTAEYTTTRSETSTNSSGRPYETNRNGDIIWLDEQSSSETIETNEPTDPSNRGPGVTTSAGSSSASGVMEGTTKSGEASSTKGSMHESTSATNTTSSIGETISPQPSTSQATTVVAPNTSAVTPTTGMIDAPESKIQSPAPSMTGENGGPGVN